MITTSSLVEIAVVCTVELIQALRHVNKGPECILILTYVQYVLGSVAMYYIQKNSEAHTVGSVNKFFKILGGPYNNSLA